MEATPAEVSSTERISSEIFELSSRIHRRPIRVLLLDSGSANNYISDHVTHLFDLIIQSKEGSRQLIHGWIKSVGTTICLLLIAV